MPFRITLSDLESLSETFNDMEHRAAPLRQLTSCFIPPALHAAVRGDGPDEILS